MTLYLDSSAIVKLLVREAESDRLREELRRRSPDQRATSALSRVETSRAAHRLSRESVAEAGRMLAAFRLLDVDDDVLERAAGILPGSPLRSLDAIHLASAQSLRGELAGVVTYDRRMIEAAQQLGLPTVSP